MKNLLIGSLFLLAIWACTNSKNKNSDHSSADVNQMLKQITNADFKAFVKTFAVGKLPWDVRETPSFRDDDVPANFHKMSLESVKKFSPDATESNGYYTGYAFFEDKYIAIIYFYSYSSLFGGDNFHTSVNLLTFSYDGKLIYKMLLGESNTSVNSSARRESQKMVGSINADKLTTIKINNYLEEELNGRGEELNFIIKPDGEIERTASGLADKKIDKSLAPVQNNANNDIASIKIGSQTWALKNLDVRTFRNGDTIPEAKSDEDWNKSRDERKAAWCYYNNDPANGEKYGKLYNWYAVNDPRGLAPQGWHIPSDAEWTSLTDNLGGDAGTQMKCTSGWAENGNGTNKSGFTALPGGDRNDGASFLNFLNIGFWWSSTESSASNAWFRSIDYSLSGVNRDNDVKEAGFSVRCVRDL